MRIREEVLNEIRDHARGGYPNEICGLLLGPRGKGSATSARRARNLVTDRARDRYEIDPRDQIRIQREADQDGLEVVGYYHSHPDHPAQPSVFDSARAWAGPVYLIVSVAESAVGDVGAFVASRDGGPFRPEPLEVVAAS